jgi:hypothetical protein
MKSHRKKTNQSPNDTGGQWTQPAESHELPWKFPCNKENANKLSLAIQPTKSTPRILFGTGLKNQSKADTANKPFHGPSMTRRLPGLPLAVPRATTLNTPTNFSTVDPGHPAQTKRSKGKSTCHNNSLATGESQKSRITTTKIVPLEGTNPGQSSGAHGNEEIVTRTTTTPFSLKISQHWIPPPWNQPSEEPGMFHRRLRGPKSKNEKDHSHNWIATTARGIHLSSLQTQEIATGKIKHG